MTIVRLDYQRKLKPFPRAGATLLAATVVLLALAAGYYAELLHKAAVWERKSGQFERAAKRQGLPEWLSQKEVSRQSGEIRHANTVLRQLTLPWDRLFATIEGAGGKDVALLSLAPDRDKRVVHISVEAKNAAAALDYLKVLEGEQIFDTVRVRSHQIRLQDPEKPIRFTFLAAWKDSP